MNNDQLLIAVCLFVAAMSCAFGASLVTYAIVGEINRKLPDDQRFSYLWWYPAKYERVRREYHRLYPQGRLLSYGYVLIALAFVFLLGFAWELGFFSFWTS
jgi:hypothetical protein